MRTKSKKRICKIIKFIPISFVLVLSSCSQPLYIPSTTNVPVLTKKGDFDVNVSTGSNGWDAQTGFAITNEVGVMVNTSFANRTNADNSNYNKHSFGEIGFGYSSVLNNSNLEEGKTKILFSFFGGTGVGKAAGSYTYNILFGGNATVINRGNYMKVFAQPAIGFITENVEFITALRAGYVSFFYFEQNNQTLENGNLRNNNYYLEPTITFRTGSEKIKIMWQAGASIGYYPTEITKFRNRPLIFIIGVGLNTNIFTSKK